MGVPHLTSRFYVSRLSSLSLFHLGFLGLLMGGSLLSLVEIFYHFVLKRICFNRNRETKDENARGRSGEIFS